MMYNQQFGNQQFGMPGQQQQQQQRFATVGAGMMPQMTGSMMPGTKQPSPATTASVPQLGFQGQQQQPQGYAAQLGAQNQMMTNAATPRQAGLGTAMMNGTAAPVRPRGTSDLDAAFDSQVQRMSAPRGQVQNWQTALQQSGSGVSLGQPRVGVSVGSVANDDMQLKYALQALLNVQSLDKEVFAKALGSPEEARSDFVDAGQILKRLNEAGPKLLKAEPKLKKAVEALGPSEAVKILQELGLDQASAQGALEQASQGDGLSNLRDELFNVLKLALPAPSLDQAVAKTAQRRVKEFLESRGVTKYSGDVGALRHHQEPWAAVWARIRAQYPSGVEYLAPQRQGRRVIIIGPGFGMLATPQMIQGVREAGFQLRECPKLPNLEGVSNMQVVQQAIGQLVDEINNFQPHVICAASKGGLYFKYLWEQNPDWDIPCVLINAHPNITALPNRAPLVVTQGSNDQTFKRLTDRQPFTVENEQARGSLIQAVAFKPPREGYAPMLVLQKPVQLLSRQPNGQMQQTVVPQGAIVLPEATLLGPDGGFERVDGMEELMNLRTPASLSYRLGREALEDLAETGTGKDGGVCLYLSTSGISVRPGRPPAVTKQGDGHAAPESLCKDDTLPRLIDAVASGKPEAALHSSWLQRSPPERRQAEAFLGYDPQGLKRFWSKPRSESDPGRLSGKRIALELGSEEYRAVEAIFRANPKERCYNFGNDWSAGSQRIMSIDRVQNPGQEGGTNEYYERVKSSLERQGVTFENGVHTRWLFHGSPALESILLDPVSGFKVSLSKAAMWGKGIYFARDAQYPDDHGFVGQPKADGSKEMLLCLVVSGMSCLGDETYGMLPTRHGSRHRYNSFVDALSNPEIIVVSQSAAAFPAYVIKYA